MQKPEDLSVWIDRLKNGDQQAARVIWETCFERLKQLAKSKLGMGPQRGADEEDIALSAMNSIMQRARAGKFPELDDRAALWRLLFTITVRKSVRHIRSMTTLKRSGEVDEAKLGVNHDAASRPLGLDGFAGNQLSPEQRVEELDQQNAFNSVLESLEPSLRKVVIARLEGQSTGEIDDKLGCSTRTVERKLQLLRKTWEETAA